LILTISRVLHNISRALQRKGVELIASILTNIMAFKIRRNADNSPPLSGVLCHSRREVLIVDKKGTTLKRVFN
jgi:hypothetical protein